jgi:hypothetical protein
MWDSSVALLNSMEIVSLGESEHTSQNSEMQCYAGAIFIISSTPQPPLHGFTKTRESSAHLPTRQAWVSPSVMLLHSKIAKLPSPQYLRREENFPQLSIHFLEKMWCLELQAPFT